MTGNNNKKNRKFISHVSNVQCLQYGTHRTSICHYVHDRTYALLHCVKHVTHGIYYTFPVKYVNNMLIPNTKNATTRTYTYGKSY